MKGWIKLHRTLQLHWLWNTEKPFDKRSAWIDLLLLANHEDGKTLFDNELVVVKRGEHITSEVKLAERWGWSRTKVRNFLNLLQKDGMIENIKEDKKRTRIRIVNYSIYQNSEDNKKTSENTTKEQEENKGRTRGEQEENTNKNDKNDKNEKNKKIYIQYAEFVKMTEDEYNKLVAKYGEKKVKRMIEVLDNYKGATGKKYKSDYRAILNWVADKVLKENGKDEEEDEITKEQLAYVLEQKRKKDEEAAQRAERFRKLPKEEQEKYLSMAKKIIYSNDSGRGIVWLGDYIRGEAK
jgi:hypothetical protein